MIEDLIRRARRRFLWNETLAQSAFAAAVLVAGFVLLLIFGTRYLEWWTLGIFAAAGIAIGSYRVHRRTPSQYATAVQVDENAHLHDALSTALHFADHSAGSESFRQSQRKQAEDAAGGVQLELAVPFVFPRSLYVMAALCLLATALVTLRYGVGHGLDLRAPITQLFFEDQAIRDAKKAQALYPKSKSWTDEAQSLLSKLGMAQNPEEPKPGEEDALDKAIDQALQNPAEANAKGQKTGGQGNDENGQNKAGDAQNDSPNGDPIDNGDQQANNNDQAGKEGTGKEGQQGQKSTSGKNGSPSSQQSLLSRLKDAVSNMLSKSDKNEDNSPSSQKNQQSAKNENQNGQKGQAGKGAQEKGESQSDAEGQPDSDSQSGQQAQGKLNNSGNQTPQQGGSGIGSQDGSKEIKAAAQLKAMGKISEIIGQRAATVSGETSVEVQSGNQKLHTDYSTTSAAHAETDGDVTRDEIPVALQAYVQQYFAEVRKAGAAKPKAAAKQP